MKLSKRSYDHAKKLIQEGHAVFDDRDDWSEHQPSASEENTFIEAHGLEEYGKWHLGIDESASPDTKRRYRFPFGDFRDVHRCAVLSAESRAGQYKHADIKSAAAHLHGMIEASAPASHRR
jgi:hypothetical protein